MSILSVPLSAELEKVIAELVARGVAANKSELARRAIVRFAEEEAIRVVLEAEREADDGKVLFGDPDELSAIFPE